MTETDLMPAAASTVPDGRRHPRLARAPPHRTHAGGPSTEAGEVADHTSLLGSVGWSVG